MDNEAVATILNTGASREPLLQNILREIAFITATNQFVIRARHIAGVTNRVPDWLSRWHTQEARRAFHEHAAERSLKRIIIKEDALQLSHKW